MAICHCDRLVILDLLMCTDTRGVVLIQVLNNGIRDILSHLTVFVDIGVRNLISGPFRVLRPADDHIGGHGFHDPFGVHMRPRRDGMSEFKFVSDAAKSVIASRGEHLGTFERDDRVIRLSVAAIEEEGGSVAGAVALLMDMTEAERLEQTRRDYVANVSHELRTPLASIRGIADMLNDGLVKSEEDKQRYYGYIQKESIRLSNLINDLLELSRLQSGGVALKLSKMELYELAADVADRFNEAAVEHGMTLRLDVPEGKYLANSNPDRVEQVLVSLADNAVKHGKEGGEITIGLDEKDEKWVLWVENPADIERKDLEHIFERFYKADIAHTGEGTGLGLAITEEVLHLLGETIRADYEDGRIRFSFTVAKYK